MVCGIQGTGMYDQVKAPTDKQRFMIAETFRTIANLHDAGSTKQADNILYGLLSRVSKDEAADLAEAAYNSWK